MLHHKSVQLARVVPNGHVLTLDKPMRIEAIARLVICDRPIVIVEDPGRAVGPAGAVDESSVAHGLAVPYPPDAAPVARLVPALGVEMARVIKGGNDVVPVERAALRMLGTSR